MPRQTDDPRDDLMAALLGKLELYQRLLMQLAQAQTIDRESIALLHLRLSRIEADREERAGRGLAYRWALAKAAAEMVAPVPEDSKPN
jgi:hypothetical protein